MESKLSLRRAMYRGAAQQALGSGSIWSDLPINIDDPAVGYHRELMFDDLPKHASTAGGSVTSPLGEWHAYLDQGGFIDTQGIACSGMKCGSDGDDELVCLIHGGSAKTLWSKTSPKAWFEASFGSSTGGTATKNSQVVGLTSYNLAATAVLIADGDVLADRDFIGFHKLETGGQVDFVYKAAGQTAQTGIANVFTLPGTTAATVLVGFKHDPKAGVDKKFQVFANGVSVGFITDANLAAATWPSTVNLGAGLTSGNATASTPGYGIFNWIRLAQRLT